MTTDAPRPSHGQAPVRLRPIEPGDDPRIASIIRSVLAEFGAVGEGYAFSDPEVEAMSTAYADPARAAYFVAEMSGRLIGGGGIGPLEGAAPDICELRKMYLLPEARGFGVGRRLLERCLDTARALGYLRCYLETLRHMVRARALYESYGFTILPAPLGATGHTGCDLWYALDLVRPAAAPA
ncbi:MAG: GNAT family N-acetyltransferase [Gemmatimonadota bacterium]